MTNPNNDRLTRMENLVEENARAISALVDVVTIHQQNIEVVFNEIRGLRTESARILGYLFEQQERGSDDEPQQ